MQLNYIYHSNTWSWGKRVIIVTSDGCGIISVSFYRDESETAYIHGLSVVEEKRKSGYGNALIKEAEKIAQQSNIKHIFISAEQKWIMRWYERLGYVVDKRDGEEIVLRKDII